ncbi:kinase-like domain-containing protein [Paraphoma chrysanthemicola]|uniref:Kinase-like domain-containing protein n=1 Tax=Paraphoma chrysanthemicola TaxID=798071 RepID=A0A8K0R295_9PLEO|nr:kinase-like domain-containing protein [Paraphoma chrysanthemicola]
MASKRGSMMLPSDFSLEDFAMTPSEQTHISDQAEQVETAGAKAPEEQELRTDSRYYSLVSDRSSMQTFYTARSSFASSMRDSVALDGRLPKNPKTPWQMTLREKNLISSEFDETNWSGRGQHAEFGPEEDSTINEVLRPEGVLGHSATAIVERVRCKRIILARKKIRCNWRLKREDAIEEVACLQRLNHAHVIRCVGTYVQRRELSILLYPAASHNLETFLDWYTDLDKCHYGAEFHSSKTERQAVQEGLRRMFGCLTSTIHFIHTHLIKHMDIKPTNILVDMKHGRYPRVYIADFGIARAYSHAEDVETDSRTSFSKTFAAPEVVRQDMRGFAADIFSLGCVFLDMLSVATRTKDTINILRQRNISGDMSYHGNLEAITSCRLLEDLTCPNLAIAKCRCLKWDMHYSSSELDLFTAWYWPLDMPWSYCVVDLNPLKSTIRDMLSNDPSRRPTAPELQDRLQTKNLCCSRGAEPFEAVPPLVLPTSAYGIIAE